CSRSWRRRGWARPRSRRGSSRSSAAACWPAWSACCGRRSATPPSSCCWRDSRWLRPRCCGGWTGRSARFPDLIHEGDLPMQRLTPALLALALAACSTNPVADAPPTVERYDLLVRNGAVYDGSGAAPRRVDVAVRGDRIAALLPPGSDATADHILDAGGDAVAPGFINVLSWATKSLIADGRGMGDTKQ